MEVQNTGVVHPASQIEDIALTATLPSEMVESQKELIAWAEKKVAVCHSECQELWAAYERAKKMKWKDKPLYNLHAAALKRLTYYEKIKAALEAGFYIVPNFDVQLFAIRTKNKKPTYFRTTNKWEQFEQKAKELPAGEGDYYNPIPEKWSDKHTKSDGTTSVEYYPKHWDEMEFPLSMAKPEIMDVTSRAMKMKIFDQLGIFPNFRKEDPVIIGQIKTKKGYTTKLVSFMIAWHLDTRVL